MEETTSVSDITEGETMGDGWEAETTQDVLDANETVVVELDDGSRLIEIEDADSYQDRFSYRVSTPYDADATVDDERRAKLWVALYALVDAFERPMGPSASIPLPVVLEGSAAVAVYLYAVRGWESESVADTLDVSRRTVWDYLHDIRDQSPLTFD